MYFKHTRVREKDRQKEIDRGKEEYELRNIGQNITSYLW
jgi:hypothetical protein